MATAVNEVGMNIFFDPHSALIKCLFSREKNHLSLHNDDHGRPLEML